MSLKSRIQKLEVKVNPQLGLIVVIAMNGVQSRGCAIAWTG